MSPVATYSNINCDNQILNHQSTETIKNEKLPNGNTDKGNRKKVIILGDSLLNGINEKGLSKRHNVKIVNKPGASKQRTLLEELQSVTKIVRLAPPAPLFNIGCKFAWLFLATTA